MLPCSEYSELPNRHEASNEYRYGFQGQEKDDEIKGEGNSYDFGARLYNPRVGRWLSVDPKANKYTSLSPYVYVANSPIINIDPNGEEIEPSGAFLNSKQLSGMYKVFNETDIYNKLTKKFKGTLRPNLAFGYSNFDNGAVADTYYYPNTEKYTTAFGGESFIGIRFDDFNIPTGTDDMKAERVYSKTYLAGVFTHELIHANLDMLLGKSTRKAEKSFEGITNYINKYGGNTARAQHEYMANNSRGDISDGMKQYDELANNVLKTDEWYDAASWQGLTHYEDENGKQFESDAWKEYKANNSIEKINYIENVLSSTDIRGEVKLETVKSKE